MPDRSWRRVLWFPFPEVHPSCGVPRRKRSGKKGGHAKSQPAHPTERCQSYPGIDFARWYRSHDQLTYPHCPHRWQGAPYHAVPSIVLPVCVPLRGAGILIKRSRPDRLQFWHGRSRSGRRCGSCHNPAAELPVSGFGQPAEWPAWNGWDTVRQSLIRYRESELDREWRSDAQTQWQSYWGRDLPVQIAWKDRSPSSSHTPRRGSEVSFQNSRTQNSHLRLRKAGRSVRSESQAWIADCSLLTLCRWWSWAVPKSRYGSGVLVHISPIWRWLPGVHAWRIPVYRPPIQ